MSTTDKQHTPVTTQESKETPDTRQPQSNGSSHATSPHVGHCASRLAQRAPAGRGELQRVRADRAGMRPWGDSPLRSARAGPWCVQRDGVAATTTPNVQGLGGGGAEEWTRNIPIKMKQRRRQGTRHGALEQHEKQNKTNQTKPKQQHTTT